MSSNTHPIRVTDEMVKEFLKIHYDSGKMMEWWERFKASRSSNYLSLGWEIVSLKTNYGSIFSAPYEIISFLKGDSPIGCTINCVRRFSDNSFWAVGENTTEGVVQKITLTDNNHCLLYTHGNSVPTLLKDAIKAPIQETKPVLTTMDGKDVFVGDKFYVEAGGHIQTHTVTESDRGYWKSAKLFSTIAGAKEYQIMNHPILSILDVQSVYEKDRSFVGVDFLINGLKELAQSKLNTGEI